MEDAKTELKIATYTVNEFVNDITKLTKENQILVYGMIKGIAAVNDVELQKKGA